MQQSQSTVLLTGATGYIGSHTWVELINTGYRVVGLDNLANSSPKVLERIEIITGKTPVFIEGDVRNAAVLDTAFSAASIDAVVHFAAFKAVGESVQRPVAYYENNLGGLLSLVRGMERHGCRRIVFSSSATVYGDPHTVPIREDFPLSATNPYGRTKLVGEQILSDLGTSDPTWRIGTLRYFNPVGAHVSGLIGEDPRGIPNNLMPYVAQVAVGKRDALSVFGNDYLTPDGTGVRDYIHVVDLALGHVAALARLLKDEPSFTVNLGTGRGYSVLEVVAAYEAASGRKVPFQIAPRRPGDVASCYADPALAAQLLGWAAVRGIGDMCADSWRWQSNNPDGFEV